MEPNLEPSIEGLGELLGTWRGQGDGEYPTIESFSYIEEVKIDHVGKPFVTYVQKSKHAATGLPLHAEAGYWRLNGNHVELIVAQPTGIAEVLEGTLSHTDEGSVFEFRSTKVSLTSTASDVTATERRFVLSGDTLSYTVAMAAGEQPMKHHLSATLNRV